MSSVEPFSLLMSAYRGTQARDLRRCLDSILCQSVLPDELIIVLDGPVAPDVEASVRAVHTVPVNILARSRHLGLGISLREGLNACRAPLVARMDTDDICTSNRFQSQLEFLQEHRNVSVLGGLLVERYRRSVGTVPVTRDMPCDPIELRSFAKLRNPLNHQTVMFRRRDVVDAGSYIDFPWFEDYHLWARMLVRGYRFANLPEVFAETDVNSAYFERRGGLAYFQQELRLAKEFRKMGFHGRLDSQKFLLTRAAFRLVPATVREGLYRRWLRRNSR